MTRFNFPKSARLLKSTEFDQVFARRCSSANGQIVLYVAPSDSPRPRLGLVVSKKCGNAVVRNRWKRALREAFRLVQHTLPENLDVVVLPRPSARPDATRLQNSFKMLASRAAQKLTAASKEQRQ